MPLISGVERGQVFRRIKRHLGNVNALIRSRHCHWGEISIRAAKIPIATASDAAMRDSLRLVMIPSSCVIGFPTAAW